MCPYLLVVETSSLSFERVNHDRSIGPGGRSRKARRKTPWNPEHRSRHGLKLLQVEAEHGRMNIWRLLVSLHLYTARLVPISAVLELQTT